MKTVHYRGELVTFEIPDHWTVGEVLAEGGAAFYDPADEFLTLQLNVLTLRAPRDLDVGEVLIAFDGPYDRQGPIERIQHDQALCVAPARREHERGQPLDMHMWRVARVVPPRTIRLAIFTTTVVVGRADPEASRATLAMLLEQVRGCTISDAPPAPRAPWWKRAFGRG